MRTVVAKARFLKYALVRTVWYEWRFKNQLQQLMFNSDLGTTHTIMSLLKIIAAILESGAITKILDHLGCHHDHP